MQRKRGGSVPRNVVSERQGCGNTDWKRSATEVRTKSCQRPVRCIS